MELEKKIQADNDKNSLDAKFLKKGVYIALFSGLSYGLYTAFMTMGMATGVWNEWYGPLTTLSSFAIIYVLGSLGSAINDVCSAFWALASGALRGKISDLLRCVNSKPGHMMILAALIGGPIAGTAYVIALQMAGSIVVPISALCPAIGAILARVLYKQKITSRTLLGIGMCLVASFLITSTSLSADAPDTMFLGICIAFIAALGWGFEGCVAGYGTALIDSEIGITIRQVTSGVTNLFIILPLFALLDGNIFNSINLTFLAFTSGTSITWFVLSGLFAFLSFMTWYKGNSMCGAALGMACNSTFAFWGPFCCWIVLGVYGGIKGWSLPPIAWIAALIMILGILIIAINPIELFKKRRSN